MAHYCILYNQDSYTRQRTTTDEITRQLQQNPENVNIERIEDTLESDRSLPQVWHRTDRYFMLKGLARQPGGLASPTAQLVLDSGPLRRPQAFELLQIETESGTEQATWLQLRKKIANPSALTSEERNKLAQSATRSPKGLDLRTSMVVKNLLRNGPVSSEVRGRLLGQCAESHTAINRTLIAPLLKNDPDDPIPVDAQKEAAETALDDYNSKFMACWLEHATVSPQDKAAIRRKCMLNELNQAVRFSNQTQWETAFAGLESPLTLEERSDLAEAPLIMQRPLVKEDQPLLLSLLKDGPVSSEVRGELLKWCANFGLPDSGPDESGEDRNLGEDSRARRIVARHLLTNNPDDPIPRDKQLDILRNVLKDENDKTLFIGVLMRNSKELRQDDATKIRQEIEAGRARIAGRRAALPETALPPPPTGQDSGISQESSARASVAPATPEPAARKRGAKRRRED